MKNMVANAARTTHKKIKVAHLKMDEINKSTNEWTRKRELLNARIRKCRKRKRNTSEQLDSLAHNKLKFFTSIAWS
ncbi:hypothetical protein TNCV_947891 [Trichonephila clavipes]|nr:hypothetical protein TNCV_947891 [Trichonephila clavipes]